MRCRAPSEAAREREALEEEVEAAVARRRACGGARGRLVPLVTLRRAGEDRGYGRFNRPQVRSRDNPA